MMSGIEARMRDIARTLLEEKKVDLVIGYTGGSLPLRATPYFARTPEEAKNLVWNRGCENNLANYLVKRQGKIAVVAKGCDGRAITALVQENQVERENIYIIGVPCRGVYDRAKMDCLLDGVDLAEASESEGKLLLSGSGIEVETVVDQVIHDSCKTCRQGSPLVYDQMAGEPLGPGPEDSFEDVKEFESLSPEARKAALTAEFSRCIRCYACRNACPMCYCSECFVDCSSPEWVKKTPQCSDNIMFQTVRVLHSAGRCADCGACHRACPMGLNIRRMTRKMVREVKELYGNEAGMKPDEKPALTTFALDDPQPFLVKE